MSVLRNARAALRPPERLSLSKWAEKYYRLSPESSATPGRWHPFPYQVEIMDALTDPDIWRVTFMKSARVGATKILNAVVGYHAHVDPCAITVVQPTEENARMYSVEEIDAMIRDCPELFALFGDPGKRTSRTTRMKKEFPGGLVQMVGSNSGAGFRRTSRRVMLLDEVDAYSPSAGLDGDQIELAINRTMHFPDRLVYACSTPLIAGTSRIEEMYLQGDQRRYYVPCPHCGHYDILVFREHSDADTDGHVLQWPRDKPADAYFRCAKGGCAIEHSAKYEMVANGEWRARTTCDGHASFFIWSAYSLAPNASWGSLATRFVRANEAGPQRVEKLRTIVNTELGETWVERGEAPDETRLYERLDPSYTRGQVPTGVVLLTAGVDPGKNGFYFEVVGWGKQGESWSVDYGHIEANVENQRDWKRLNQLLTRRFSALDSRQLRVRRMALDAGNWSQQAYRWGRTHSSDVVMLCKGMGYDKPIGHSAVSPVRSTEVSIGGRRMKRGNRYWPIGVGVIKHELYGFLRLVRNDDNSYPPGWCHFPLGYERAFFSQLTAEHLVKEVSRRTRRVTLKWKVRPGRENHWLDTRIYARAAALTLRVDDWSADHAVVEEPPRPRSGESVHESLGHRWFG